MGRRWWGREVGARGGTVPEGGVKVEVVVEERTGVGWSCRWGGFGGGSEVGVEKGLGL